MDKDDTWIKRGPWLPRTGVADGEKPLQGCSAVWVRCCAGAGNKLRVSARAAGALSHWAIPPHPSLPACISTLVPFPFLTQGFLLSSCTPGSSFKLLSPKEFLPSFQYLDFTTYYTLPHAVCIEVTVPPRFKTEKDCPAVGSFSSTGMDLWFSVKSTLLVLLGFSTRYVLGSERILKMHIWLFRAQLFWHSWFGSWGQLFIFIC